MEKQPQLEREKNFLVTVAAFNALDAGDIEQAIRVCPWTHTHFNGMPVHGLGPDGFVPSDFIPSMYEGRGGQAFCLASKTDGAEQLVLLPDEVECQDNAFGPSPFSSQFEQYRRTYSLDLEKRGHADFNLVVIPAATVSDVGWAAVQQSVLRFARGDFGEHREAATALTEGGRYSVASRWLRIARDGECDVLCAALLK